MLDGLSTSVAIKAPCVTVATSNITLAGLQTIGGVALAEGDRVLVVGQTNTILNGIYNASTGQWQRTLDFDGARDVVQGTLVNVMNANGVGYELVTEDPVIDTTALVFEARDFDATLRGDLAAGTGATLVTFVQTGTGAISRTSQSKLAERFSHKDFNVTADGVTNDTTAAGQAETAAAKAEITSPMSVLLRDPSTVSVQQRIIGQGWTSDVLKMPTGYWKKRSNGTQVAMTGDYSGLFDLTIDGDKAGGKTGDGVQVAATRQTLDHISSLNQQGVGIRHGGTGATGTFNANILHASRASVVSSTGDGIYEHHTGGTITGTYPAGIPDCNASLYLGCEVRLAGGVGWKKENSIDNTDVGSVIQSTTGKGRVYKSGARGHKSFGLYVEGCNGGGGAPGDEVDFESGATENLIIGLRSNQLAGAGLRDVNTAGKNCFIHYDAGVGSWVHRARLSLWNPFEDGSTKTNLDVWCGTTPVNAYNLLGSVSGTSGGVYELQTKIDGGALTTRMTVRANGDVVFTGQTTGTLFGGKTAFDTTTAGVTIENGVGRLDIVNTGTGATTLEAFYNGNGQVGSISTNASATTFATSSDRRLKSQIKAAPDQGTVIDAIEIVEHEFKAAPGVKHIGVIADQLQKVYPDAVIGAPDAEETRDLQHDYTDVKEIEVIEDEASEILDLAGNPVMKKTPRTKVVTEHKIRCETVHRIVPQGVDYSKLVPLLIAEVQSLRRRVTELEAR